MTVPKGATNSCWQPVGTLTRVRFPAIAGASVPGDAAEAIKLGASGMLLKSEAPECLVQAITLVANGAV
jgi:DNA-binding NarL/FixJ family response regulator